MLTLFISFPHKWEGRIGFWNQNSVIVSGFANQVWIATVRLQAVMPECAWGLWLTKGTPPLRPLAAATPSAKSHFNFIFQKSVEFLLCAHHEGLFWKKIKISFVLPPSTPYEMSWVEKTHKLYQTKGSYIWNIMCSFQQGGKLHLLSSDMSFFKVLLIFRYIFLVCVLIKLPNQSSGLHQCKGFWEDYCILYPCGYKDTGVLFLFPFHF